mgnify:CR=1 FL=1|jgi:hypothetical protein
MMQRRKLPVLNVFATRIKAKEAFTKATEELSFIRFSYRNLVIETEEYLIQYQYYINFEDAREKLMGREYWKIYFFCDLEPEVKQLCLSRVRVFV